MDLEMYVKPDQPVDQEDTAYTLRYVAEMLDALDDEHVMRVNPSFLGAEANRSEAWAWMWAALLIANEAAIPQSKIRKLANQISKGVQGVL